LGGALVQPNPPAVVGDGTENQDHMEKSVSSIILRSQNMIQRLKTPPTGIDLRF
jgi:hypothetical protein